jgi:predicted DCC family thiol-disulfide oxidoreductase YuxK
MLLHFIAFLSRNFLAETSLVPSGNAVQQRFPLHATIDRQRSEKASPCYASRSVPSAAPETEYVFYDGYCGLCHRTVQFVLKHDSAQKVFRFAPLQGPTFEQRVPLSQRSGLPDSIVVLTSDRRLLVRSNAILHILRRLGGSWKIFADAMRIFPLPIRDAAYDFIARIRYFVFGRRNEVCPIVPPDLQARFDP